MFGCGGVGNAAIAGARLAGAHTIIAVDIDDRKLEWAKEFGATHTVNSATTDPVESIKAVTGGNGADVCIEAVGNPDGVSRRRSTPATWPAPSCWSACPAPT